MKLVSKSVIGRFSNQTYSVQSFMEVMGRQPHHIGGYIRLKKQYSLGLMAITEGLGNVYTDGVSKAMKGVDTYSFTWDIDVSQIPTIRITRPNTATGQGGVTFKIYVESNYFSPYDVAALENTQQIYIQDTDRIGENEFELTCQVVASNPQHQIDTTFTQERSTLRYVYNAHPEFSEKGYNKHFYNTERHINYLTKIRAGQPYSSDLKATQDLYFMSEEDLKTAQKARGGHYKVFRLSSIEQQVLDHFLTSANGQLILGRSTIDENTGRPLVQDSRNQDVIMGDGIIAQYERHAYHIDYSRQSIKFYQDAIEYIADKRGVSQGNHITVLCNRRFSRQKAAVLQNAITLFAPQNDGTWFYTKDPMELNDQYGGMRKGQEMKRKKLPNEVAVGATFNTYIYEGNTITFIVDEALTNHYRDRGYAIFIDTGIYEDENGQVPAVSLKTLKGRELIKNYITGMGGIDGSSNGQVSHAADYTDFQVLGWRGACVRNPYGAVIFQEQV